MEKEKNIMSRCAMLSAGGDPFIAFLVVKLFQERFYNEIDRLYINYNNHAGVPVNVAAEFCSRVTQDPKIHLIYHPSGIGNGMPITEMTLISKEDHVMLLEDDGFIFEPGIVNDCFARIESGETDIVGSPRGSCGIEIWNAVRTKYNLDYTGYGDVGPTWWPNFFFCKRADLLRTDLNFASKEFTKDTYYIELSHTMSETQYGDTFVWASLQLRNMGLQSISVPQHKLSPYEIEDKLRGEQNYHPALQPFKWLHGGSLSSGWGGYLSGRIPEFTEEGARYEIESRVACWKLASDVVEGFDSFKTQYKEGIEILIVNANLNPDRIQKKYHLVKQLLRV